MASNSKGANMDKDKINLAEINDVNRLKVLLADSFVARENAAVAHQEANHNIEAISARIIEINDTPKVSPDNQEAI
jgi:hypothetical protein